MCTVADVAMVMVNESIRMAQINQDSRYYMDFIKLHKLLYLGQCCMLRQYERPLFAEDIRAHHCGPTVDRLDFIPAQCGFGTITESFSSSDIAIPSPSRLAVIDWVLENFGTWSTEDIIHCTKATPPYKMVKAQITETTKPVIPIESMSSAFDNVSAFYYGDGDSMVKITPESLTTVWA